MTMPASLYRREVLEARRAGWLGTISLLQPLSIWLLTAFFAIATLLVIGLLVFGEYRFRSRVTGRLVPDLGLSIVVAPTTGVVTKLFSEEGLAVEHEQGLILISVPRSTSAGTDALQAFRTGLTERRRSLERIGQSQLDRIEAQRNGAAQQLARAREELAQIERELAARSELVRISNDALARYRAAARNQYLSVVELQTHEQRHLESVIEQQSLERQAISVRRTIAQFEQTLSELPSERDLISASTRRDLVALDQERIEQEAGNQMLVKSPIAGLIASQFVAPGQTVQAGQPLFTVLPHKSRLRAELLVPSSAVGFIEPDDRVLLRYQAYPYQKFGNHGGRVIRMSRSPINPSVAALTPGGNAEGAPLYRVLVELDEVTITAYGKPEPLRPGLLVEADILGDRRRIFEWILEPLYTLTGRTAG